MSNKISVELSAETGGFIAGIGGATRSVSRLTEEMKKAKKEKNWDDYARLQMQRDSLTTSAAGFKKDTQSLFSDPRYHTQTASGGLSGIKMDKEQAAIFEDLTDSIKKLTAKYDDQMERGQYKEAGETFKELDQKYKEYHEEVAYATAPDGIQSLQNAAKAVGIGQIANAINDGFSRWVSTLDRSGIVNQYGSGDILGGRIAEERREADLRGGIAQSGLGIAGTALGSLIGGQGGALVGGTVGAAGGKAIDSVLHIGPNKDATEAAYAGLWQNRSSEAMELAAVMGSANDVREAFKTAADSAARFGYSAEEGMDAMKQAAQQGLSGEDAAAVTEQVFDFERRTGADRGTLLGLSTMSARYGAGDALGAGWAGLQASGMKAGQYNEYLRAMQRVMEDGISKGFVRSSDEVASSLTMLTQMTGNSPLWQGENGGRRLMDMNAGLESATGLASASDILAFRGAQNVLENDRDGKLWNSIANVDGKEGSDIKKSGSYIDAMILMERGLNADTFGEIMKLNSQAEGGDRSAVIERMRQQFSLNYTNSAMLYDQWDEQTEHGTREMPKENAQTLVSAYGKEPPPANSPELDAAKTTEAIKNWWTQTGISHWDANFPDILLEELRKAIQEYNDETGSDVPLPPLPPLPSLSDIDTTGMTSLEIERQAQENYRAALKRGTGDNAERAYRELETAQMNALNPAPSIFDPENLARMEQQAQSSLSGLFSPGFALNPFKSDEQKGDRSGMNRTLDTVSGAIYSGDAGQIQAAKDVLDMLAKLPADVRKDWDKENTANALGGDGIAALRSDLRELIEVEINNGRVHVMVEEPRP